PLSPRARELIRGCAREDLAISAITLLELARHLRNGAINTGDPASTPIPLTASSWPPRSGTRSRSSATMPRCGTSRPRMEVQLIW
ncbi:MAG TPA: hypothetical protein VHV47_05360, partial [Opitutaceae bacterium]|nr:hypothetical protein [Opitutaceae bacterium]